jgi:hypothetical protein
MKRKSRPGKDELAGIAVAAVPTGSEQTDSAVPKPRTLRIFISYAHEDAKIAIAVSNTLQVKLTNVLTEVFLDKTSLETGFAFDTQIKERLATTDVLIIIYTGVGKPSHSYTGWEVGFFMGVQRSGNDDAEIPRRIVPLYLHSPPATTTAMQGIGLGITHDLLKLTETKFRARLETTVAGDDPMVKFLDELQEIEDRLRRRGGFPKGNSPDSVKCACDMYAAIFAHLKTTVETTLKPQEQISIATNVAALQASDDDLPPDAQLTTVGSGSPMSIFGLPDPTLPWSSFVSKISDHRLGTSWREAIVSVVISSLRNKMEIDNSQVIVSSDEKHVYRVILTTSTSYYNGNREFSLYFVEALRRNDYGNRDTTLLLKGLELVCRFRFMFLEEKSEFSKMNILAISLDRVPELAQALIQELNLLRRDAQEARLDLPNVWSNFISWDIVVDMSRKWQDQEKNIRGLASAITALKRSGDDTPRLEEMRVELAREIDHVSKSSRANNGLLIKEMTAKLASTVG